MERLLNGVFWVSKVLNYIAAGALTFMICTTVVDVFFRTFGQPFIGAYEIVGLICGPLVIGLAIPLSSWNRNHVSMEFVLLMLSKRKMNILNILTRIICILLFVFIGYNLLVLGNYFRSAGEVSPTLLIPFYWITYVVGLSCFIECVVFMGDIIRIWRERA
jgi:TRAP-type C4-dicarboxylate transport system permease small subunit